LRINKARLSYRIFFTLTSVLLLLFVFLGWIIFAYVESVIQDHLERDLKQAVTNVETVVKTSADISIRSYLRAVAEQQERMVAEMHRRSLAGEITEEDARARAAETLLLSRLGLSGYCYVLNSQGTVLVHPDKELLQKNVGDFPFVQEQIKIHEGIVKYNWRNPGEKEARPKILYSIYFQPWDWFISVTAYRDELSWLIKPLDFRDNLLDIRIGEQGYPFLFDEDGKILFHPRLHGNIYQLDDPEADFLRLALADSLNKEDQHSSGFINNAEDEIVFTKNIAQLGWVVGAIGHEEDFYKPERTLVNIFVALLLLCIILTILVSYYLSRSVTEPLNRLLASLSASAAELNLKPFIVGNKDEIEEISAYCANYVESLKNNNHQLQQLFEDQRKTASDLQIFKEVFENTAEGVTITDNEGTILQANPAFARITGYPIEDVLGENPRILKSGRHEPEFYTAMWESIVETGFWSGEIWNKKRNGQIYPELLTISAIRDRHGEITHYAAMFNDISTIIEQQERIEYLAYHDHLTKLPNRLLLLDRLQQATSICRRNGGEVVCMVLDIDNFKTVNDSMGHAQGDELLIKFVERIRHVVRDEDTLARMGGDDFVYVFRNLQQGIQYILPVVERFQESVEEPFQLQNQKVYVSLSIGIAVYPEDSLTTDDLLKRADLALYNAKRLVGNSYQFFSRDMEVAVVKKLHYLAKIRQGLELHEFVPFFQPKVDLKTGKAVGMEALARWRAGGNLVNPGDFIPLAEESGLIVPMARQIYEIAFKETVRLRAAGHDLYLSVNLAPFQLRYENFLAELIQMQERSGLSPEFIEFEVTESSLMENVEKSKNVLQSLSGAGFTVSIDDFGTGYSSLQYLKQLPLNALKIDMAFVSGIGIDIDDETLIRTIVLMAKQFGLSIVAEGVEEKFQEEFLAELGCDLGQGYYYGKPMEAGQFAAWLAERA